MREHRIVVCLAVCLLLLILQPLYTATGQNYYEYKVQIQGDGSAFWTVTQFSSANTTVDSWDNFQNRIYNLVDQAATATNRAMAIDERSIQINTTISQESKTTEYSFLWQNFSVINGGQLTLGDVFQVNDFFGQLYGDAALQLNYPAGFVVQSVSPAPYERQDSTNTMRWSRTQDLVDNNVKVVLAGQKQGENVAANDWQQYAVITGGSAVAFIVVVFGFYAFKRRKNNGKVAVVAPSIETDEEKIIKLLKSAGGSMRQSEITDQSRFSKAKTSQLLAALEKSGNITRYKKGRDKIVTFKE